MLAATAGTMKLDTLIHDLEVTSSAGSLDVEVTGIAHDSRAVGPGDVFVAVRGARSDGHGYLADALAAGAVAVVTEEPVDAGGAAALVVENSATALARMAAHFYGDPADALRLCGVTGTNGKSSTALMLWAIGNASAAGSMGVIGTLGWGTGELQETTHTTPDALALHAILRDLKDSGCFGVVMEVSSHAVRQHRTCGLDFSVGILTNITHDHLDYHADWQDYRDAKKEFTNSLVAHTRRRDSGTLVY
jgi:UDP-N-acetylmuramoyl-L-alanyl-D-glutamate--2,6-diaminopimelate ligase